MQSIEIEKQKIKELINWLNKSIDYEKVDWPCYSCPEKKCDCCDQEINCSYEENDSVNSCPKVINCKSIENEDFTEIYIGENKEKEIRGHKILVNHDKTMGLLIADLTLEEIAQVYAKGGIAKKFQEIRFPEINERTNNYILKHETEIETNECLKDNLDSLLKIINKPVLYLLLDKVLVIHDQEKNLKFLMSIRIP